MRNNTKAVAAGILTAVTIFLQMFGNGLPIVSPLSDSKISALSQATIKLEQKENVYALKKQTNFLPQASAASPYDNASAYALIDYDTGDVIAEKSLSTRIPVASLTKIITAITALDLMSPDDLITITENSARAIPTKIVLIPGEKLTLRELLNASLLTSANDATQAIADGINTKYGDNIFVKAMNIKTHYIGLKNSHFANPQGFDNPKNYSTAEDLAILTHYALTHYPLIDEIVRKESEFLQANNYHREYKLLNWNGLIGVYPGVYGMKIGNTGDAGTTMVATAEREGKKVMAVVLGASDILERDLWASQLLDMAFQQTADLYPIGVTEYDLRWKYSTWY